MKRARLLAHLQRNDCVLLREGAKHSIYMNLKTGARTSVPRHVTLLPYTVRAICKQLGISYPH
ncbi:MAG: type II toxin-antitoxin system HicA family toxin [bacterium]|nr:type II toxin-antitoxin system HicA family toxin [bacterium]